MNMRPGEVQFKNLAIRSDPDPCRKIVARANVQTSRVTASVMNAVILYSMEPYTVGIDYH